MPNDRNPTVIIGQTTASLTEAIEKAADKAYSNPFVFASAGNTRKYNKSKGKSKK